MREVKLAETLKRLVDEGEYRGNRKRVCAELGITTAALSQYLRGQTTPSVDKLIAIGDLFKVSLDYLMFGEDAIAGQGGTLEYGPLTRYVEAGISSVQSDIAAQSAYIAKIGSIITDQIAAAARTAAKRPATLLGMLDKEQAIELERFSEASTIVTMNLGDDVVPVVSDVEQGVTAGSFLTVVAENLARERTYHFILSPDLRDTALLVRQYRDLLRRQDLTGSDLERCQFSVARDTFHVGYCLFALDIPGLKRHSPVLYQFVRPYLGDDNVIGYIEPPSSPFQAYFLMDEEHRRMATRVLDRLSPPGAHA